MSEMCVALLIALVKLYDNYKTPLGCNVKCYKSRYCPKDQMWDTNRFIVWIEHHCIDTKIIRIGFLVEEKYWNKFNIMINYNDVPSGIIIDNDTVIEALNSL